MKTLLEFINTPALETTDDELFRETLEKLFNNSIVKIKKETSKRLTLDFSYRETRLNAKYPESKGSRYAMDKVEAVFRTFGILPTDVRQNSTDDGVKNKDDLEYFYDLKDFAKAKKTFKFKNIVSPNDPRKLLVRGHNINRENTYNRTVNQESAQAVAIADKLNIQPNNILLRLNYDKVEKLYREGNPLVCNAFKTGEAFINYHGFKNKNFYGICDRSAGPGRDLIEYFNDIKDKPKGIIDVWCPADIYVYDSLTVLNKLDSIDNIEEFTKTFNSLVMQKRFIPISLKLNSNRDTSDVEFVNFMNKKAKSVEVVDYAVDSKVANTITLQAAIKDRSKKYVVNLSFKMFTKSTASVEGALSGTKKFDTEIFTNMANDYNINCKLGKAKQIFFNYISSHKTNNKIEKNEDRFIKWIIANFGEKAIDYLPGTTNTRTTLYPEVKQLWQDWLFKIYSSDYRNDVKEAILYTLFAGEKINYGDMVQFPKYYKIS